MNNFNCLLVHLKTQLCESRQECLFLPHEVRYQLRLYYVSIDKMCIKLNTCYCNNSKVSALYLSHHDIYMKGLELVITKQYNVVTSVQTVMIDAT